MNIQNAIMSILEQLYPGHIEILAVIDGAPQHQETHYALNTLQPVARKKPYRHLVIIPKSIRGGRVSTINTGFAMAHGEIVMVLDGDTSCDNNMMQEAVKNFIDPNVVGVTGALRARNANKGLATALQSIEYMLAIHAGKTGLNAINAVNNISGAFGVFRHSFMKDIMGWDSGTAEDLDLTLRIKSYFGRHPNLRILFEPKAIALTDVPDTFSGYFQQRLRWDGDLFYIYARKHWPSINPKTLGWSNFLSTVLMGLMFQLALPFAILLYLVYIAIAYPLPIFLGIMGVIYIYYLLTYSFLFFQYLWMISDRKQQDLKKLWLLFITPFFSLISRIWTSLAVLTEIITRSHQDTSMAPWWVLKKSKF